MNLFRPVLQCPLCGANSSTAANLFQVRQADRSLAVLRCRQCGLGYKEAFPTPELMSAIYSAGYIHFQEEDGQGLQARVRRLGSKRGNGRHLDYGCGAGSFVAAARAAGWDSYGADPYLQPSKNPRLFRLPASGVHTLGRFDCITLWAVMEHLTDPLSILENLSDCLAPGGVMIFNSPNPDSLIARKSGTVWRLATLVEHVIFWSPDSVRWLAGRLNLKIERLFHCGSPYPCGKGSGDPGDQGISHVEGFSQPATTPTAQPIPPERKTAPRLRVSRMVMGSVNRLAGSTQDNWVKDLLRWGIRTLRTGDHIEAALVRS